MKILNIHGYHGSTENSAYKALKELGCEIISPPMDYDGKRPGDIAGELKELYDEYRPDVIVGTSLGGFFASVLCAERSCKTILVNPCLMPFLMFDFETRTLVGMFGGFSDIRTKNVSCIVGGNDEVLGDHKFTERLFGNERFRRIEGAGHSGATLPLKEYFAEVLVYYKGLK
ncbi:YqiA/YcfP family alpha/beta fold hydrolase [Ruminococcus sp. NK3A76]|uniref:YqiA/YcfP family alpha/beta fold hydrolase n=1 Tax=Ruminococcus sp. NK3A76 TaxID=877411 RepID=UPI00048CE69E|nr:YqiA/YcfP family alpha/beta fold hydrolase [Ruminococcus sp. NK3A76]